MQKQKAPAGAVGLSYTCFCAVLIVPWKLRPVCKDPCLLKVVALTCTLINCQCWWIILVGDYCLLVMLPGNFSGCLQSLYFFTGFLCYVPNAQIGGEGRLKWDGRSVVSLLRQMLYLTTCFGAGGRLFATGMHFYFFFPDINLRVFDEAANV